MDKTAWQDPPWSSAGQHEMREGERRRAEKRREDDRARMDRIEAKLDQLLGNHGVRVYDADGNDITAGYEVTYNFSGSRLSYRTPQTAERVIERLQVMGLLPDGSHHLYAQDLHAPSRYNRLLPTEFLPLRSCKIQAQKVAEAIPA